MKKWLVYDHLKFQIVFSFETNIIYWETNVMQVLQSVHKSSNVVSQDKTLQVRQPALEWQIHAISALFDINFVFEN